MVVFWLFLCDLFIFPSVVTSLSQCCVRHTALRELQKSVPGRWRGKLGRWKNSMDDAWFIRELVIFNSFCQGTGCLLSMVVM